MPVPVAALLAVGQAGYSLYKSNKQKKAAKKLKESNWTPPAVEEAISSQRLAANASSPEYARGLERLKQSTANSIDASKKAGGTSGQIQQGIADSDAREKENIKDLQVADASFKNDARDRLTNLLQTKGGYQQQSRDAFNAAKSALTGASEQNQYNAVTTLGEGIVNSLPDSAFDAKASQPAGVPGATKIPTARERAVAQMSGKNTPMDMQNQMANNRRGLKRLPGAGGNPYGFDYNDPNYSRYKLNQ
ncbi:MAG: hypothetical protein WKF87_06735 [Chryseolinea sp.]